MADSAAGRRAHPPAGRRRPGAGDAAPAGARSAARGEPRSRRRAGAEAGGRPLAQGVDPLRDDQAGHGARGRLGLAQHLHVHEEHGRPAGGARDGIVRAIVRPAIVESAVAYPFRGWNEGFTTSAPLVYLALKGQNMLPVSPKLILDVVPVDHVVSGDADGGGAGDRRAAEAGVPAVERRPEPAAHGSRRHADRALQAQALPGQGDRQQASSTSWRRAWSSGRSPRPNTTGIRSRPAARHRQEGVRDAGAHPPALGRGALHRGRRSDQEGLRRGRSGHHRGGGEHRAVPPVHLREQLHLPRRQHPRAARPDAARRSGAADVGARERWISTTTG